MTPREIKQALNHNVLWKPRNGYGAGAYRLTGVAFRRNEKTGEYFYQCILEDTCRNVIIAKMNEVEITEQC